MLKWSSSYRKKQSNSSSVNHSSQSLQILTFPSFWRLTQFCLIAGALDTTKIHVVPKHSINESAMRKAPMKILNLPFEATFRLQVRICWMCCTHWCFKLPKVAMNSLVDGLMKYPFMAMQQCCCNSCEEILHSVLFDF